MAFWLDMDILWITRSADLQAGSPTGRAHMLQELHMHDLIQENQGPESSSLFIFFFSGVRMVFRVKMAKLRHVGRGDRG